MENGDLAEVLRLIINLVPANEIMKILRGSIDTLPFVGQWNNVCLDGDMVVWSAENLKCGFYLFGLPPAWAKWFALEDPVPGHLVGRPELDQAFCGVMVVPMGWASGTGLVQ